MRIEDFELERFFARYEFNVRHLLCASDVEGWPMAELLALADTGSAELWHDLRLGYTEAPGHPLLRREIAGLYESIDPDEVLVFSGAEEAIFVAANVLLGPGDHAIVAWPSYQSLHAVARATGADVTLHELRAADGWAIDPDALRAQVTPRTRLIVVNVPHNPTGAVPDAATYRAVVEIAAEAGATLFSDQVYRFLEHDRTDRLPAGADAAPHGVSLGVMSKSFALAGLRIGWLATHDARLRDAAARFKDYTTICASAPAEILALIALRSRDRVLARSRGIVEANLALLDELFVRRAHQFRWVRPRGGPVGFPELLGGVPVDRFAQDLLEAEGVLIAPGDIFGHPGNHFRLGFGRTDLPAALAGLEAFADRTLGEARLTMSEWVFLIHPPREDFAATITPAEEEAWGRHWTRMKRLYDAGSIILVGPTLGRVNTGICVFEAPDEAAALALMNDDPVIAEGFAGGELRPMRVSLVRGRDEARVRAEIEAAQG